MRQFILNQWNTRFLMTLLAAISAFFFSFLVTEVQADEGNKNDNAAMLQAGGGFNHTDTGFPLTGLHKATECVLCHVNGVFKGTPHNCSDCHVRGKRISATIMSTRHIVNTDVTTGKCEVCHTNTVTFLGARFNHSSAAPTDCKNCHNGFIWTGKPASHNVGFKATAPCGNCHRSVAWLPATMDHTGIVNNCASCHNGTSAMGKSATHFITTLPCENCHTSVTTFTAWKMDHTGIVNNCALCHNGSSVNIKSKSAAHFPTSGACETCHKSYTAFTPATMDHTGIVSNCASCHSGSYANIVGKTANHIPTSSTPCENCHSSTVTPGGFVTWKMSHPSVMAIACATCHTGTYPNGRGKSANHIPSTTSCDICHKSAPASWLPATMDHTGIATNCISCHGGSYANIVSKTATHIPTASTPCENCHSSTVTPGGFVTWQMSHASVATIACATCHTGTYPNGRGKPASHASGSKATLPCGNCHKSTSAWLPAGMDHTGITTNCASCHDGAQALGKSATHIPTTSPCENCHSNTTTFTVWTMNHTGITTNCISCHSGSIAGVVGKTATHIPTASTPCENCHTNTVTPGGFATWTMSHASVATIVCATCHTGTYPNGRGKPASHSSGAKATGACSTCHKSTSAWLPAGMDHTGITTGCASCHDGTQALGKTATHIPTTAPCENCHSNTTTFTAWTMNHTVVTAARCDSCHNSTYQAVGVVSLTSMITNHIPLTSASVSGFDCNACHLSTTSFASPEKMNHGAMSTGCVACHLTGANYLGSMQQLRHNGASAAKDCSSSGCHAPLGRTGTPYSTWSN